FAIAAGGWLLVRTFQITKKPVPRASFTLIGAIVGGVALLYALDSTSNAKEVYQTKQAAIAEAEPGRIITTTWIDYEPKLLEQARADGYTVVLDFTAEWCLNCKALKAAVLNKDPVKGRLAQDDIVTMTVDLTSTKAPGWDRLRELGQTGIPLLAVYGPAEDEPWLANNYTPQQVLGAIDQVGGAETAAR
ncbi:MAG: thioredoxin family protein, partial [Planctomycetota bacterium]